MSKTQEEEQVGKLESDGNGNDYDKTLVKQVFAP